MLFAVRTVVWNVEFATLDDDFATMQDIVLINIYGQCAFR